MDQMDNRWMVWFVGGSVDRQMGRKIEGKIEDGWREGLRSWFVSGSLVTSMDISGWTDGKIDEWIDE